LDANGIITSSKNKIKMGIMRENIGENKKINERYPSTIVQPT